MPQAQQLSPEDAVLADVQESANIMMVKKAQHAATIATLRQQLAGQSETLKKALDEVESLKALLKQNGIALPNEDKKPKA